MCRAILSPYIDEEGKSSIYRCNLGVTTLCLPLIYQKAKVEGKDFYNVLDYYMDLAKDISVRTVKYLKNFKASSNPLVFCEGGFDGGTLGPDDCIAPVLKRSTISFGYVSLHELQLLHNGKPLHEDQTFALEVMEHFNAKLEEYKKKDGIAAACYAVPGESLLPRLCEKFKEKFGDIPGVTDRGYFSNSFHLHVSADVTPIEKIDIEDQFKNLSKAGRITHVRFPDDSNFEGIVAITRYAMAKGLYLGLNWAQNYCYSCGTHYYGNDKVEAEEDPCPNCGSIDIIKVRRMCGYLGTSHTTTGKTKFNDGKMKEIRDRVNM